MDPGHAALGLREDWLGQLKQARDELGMWCDITLSRSNSLLNELLPGLQGVRQHGLFDDDMGPVVTGHHQYNFSSIERLWGSMVGMGLHPVVELSFMPGFLANCSWSVAQNDCHADYGIPCNYTPVPGAKRCQAGMAYRGVSDHPTDWDDWRHLVQSAVQMAVTKFGLAEVQHWRFEVWNELWGMSGGDVVPPCKSQPCIGSTYMNLYNASAVGVKVL